MKGSVVVPGDFYGFNWKVYGLIGLITGVFIALFSAFVIALTDSQGVGAYGIALGLAAIFVLPLTYGAVGFVIGVIAALVYNLLATILGGVVVVVESIA